MSNKYEFVPGDEIPMGNGRTLKRIRALIAITAVGVLPGQLGGYIEHENNLSHYGNAWVSDNARVSGNARVYSNAWVYGNTRVYGNAQVYGDARVSGNARVYGNAWVYGNARVYGDARISGDAWVYGNARVSGNARVYGDAWVYGNAWVYGDAWVKRRGQVCWFSEVGSEYGTLTMYLQKNGTIEVTRGCFKGGIDEFLKASAEKHDARIRKEYELLIEVGRSRICAEE